jgi:PEP-CTERM motif
MVGQWELSMKFRISAALAFAFFLLLSVGTVRADGTGLLAYTLTGPVDATFELPVTFTVTSGNYDLGEGFVVTPIDLTIDGSAVPGDQLIFYSASMDGAFGDADSLFSLTGPQLYTGPESHPTMTDFSGSKTLSDYNPPHDHYTLSVKSVAAPEPTSILLLGTGLLSLFLKRRQKATS